jgi:hypothetical protein
MDRPVDVPLLGALFGALFPVFLAGLALFKGLIIGGLTTFVVVRLLKGRGVAARWQPALAAGAMLFLAVSVWSWLSWSKYSWIRITASEIELHYATWPRQAHRIPFDQVESVSMTTSGRKGRVSHLVITTKSTGALDRTYWESVGGDQQYIALAIQWIEHASGGRLKHRAAAVTKR